jgi:hypothetical protein
MNRRERSITVRPSMPSPFKCAALLQGVAMVLLVAGVAGIDQASAAPKPLSAPLQALPQPTLLRIASAYAAA